MSLSDRIGVSILVTALCLPVACAQQPAGPGDQRVGPAAPASSGETSPVQQESPAPVTSPGSAVLSGPEEFAPGTRTRAPSYFLPSFQFSEMADSNFNLAGGPQRFETAESLVGRLAFQKVGKHSQFTTDYLGGGLIYNHHSELNTTMHQLGISQAYQGRRWSFLLDDRATYLQESSFGFGGFGWMGALGPGLGGAFGSNLASLNPMFNSSQSLFTGRGATIANTAVAQASYITGPRSTFSIAGSYGLLHFRTPGSIDSRNALFVAGYNRTLSSRDTIGLTYGLNLFRFRHIGRSFNTHLLELDYGHRVSGRLAVGVGGGAQVNVFRSAAAGSTTSPSWIAHGSVNYNYSRNAFALSLSRYTTNGGGLLVGAATELVQFSWSRQLTRSWSGSLGPGYSRNSSLPQTRVGNTDYIYDSVHGSASLSRALGRYTTMFFTYNYQTQRSEAVPCVAGNCRTSLGRHLLGFGFDWHPRQIMID